MPRPSRVARASARVVARAPTSSARRVERRGAARDATLTRLGDATLPHPHDDHVRLDVYVGACRCGRASDARDVRLVLPESEEAVVDVYAALGRPNDDPHWAYLGHGGVALATKIFETPELVRGKRVIDLGCGLGIAGIAAAMVGAREVVMTDREERALWCALAGCKANGVRDVREMPAVWNAPDDCALPTLPVFDDVRDCGSDCVVRAAKVDWFEPELAPGGFDVALACDVLYTPDAVDAIATLVLRLFEDDGGDGGKAIGASSSEGEGTFMLADPPGRFPKNHERFMSLMENPSRIPGFDGGGRRSIVRVTSSIEECLNLELETMAVKLSTYDIASR
jgi:predicted nicotinamide N-methyase